MADVFPFRDSDKLFVLNAAKNGKVVELVSFLQPLPECMVSTVVNTVTNRTTPLVMACRNGQLEMTKCLVNVCDADIELRGSVMVGDISILVPPLWCAAEIGHFEMVRFLVYKKANVNAVTDTDCTFPLMVASIHGHFNIVTFLVKYGANVGATDLYGNTSLMLASHKGHYQIAKHLLRHYADVNQRSMLGNTALYECAKAGHLQIAKLLLENGAKLIPDVGGFCPLITASAFGFSEIVRYIIEDTNLATRFQVIDAFELLGAAYVDRGRSLESAYKFWKRAMEMRYDPRYAPLLKESRRPVAAYEYRHEVLNMQELEAISGVEEEMQMQALLIRERILGPTHLDTAFYILSRGSAYRFEDRFQRCMEMWFYALELQKQALSPLNMATHRSIVLFTELFSAMLDWSVPAGGSGFTPRGNVAPEINFEDIMMVCRRTIDELKMGSTSTGLNDMQRIQNPAVMLPGSTNIQRNRNPVMIPGSNNMQRNYNPVVMMPGSNNVQPNRVQIIMIPGSKDMQRNRMIDVMMRLAAVLAKLLPQLTDEQQHTVHQELYNFSQLSVRGKKNCSPIHLACFDHSEIPIHNRSAFLPSVPLVQMLLKVGADVNARDSDGNTALHFAAMSGDETLVRILLDAGAHYDTVNLKRKTFSMLLPNPNIRKGADPLKHVSLKCLASRYIRKQNIEVKEDDLPAVVYSFMMKH